MDSNSSNSNNTVATTAHTRHKRPHHHRGTPAERRRLFTQALLAGRSPEESLTEAGFQLVGRKAIASTLSSLRKDPTVRATLDAEERARDATLSNTPARLEQMLSDVANADFADLFNEDGSPRIPSQIPPKVRAAVRSLQYIYNLNPDGSRSVRKASFVLESKIQAIELITELRGYIRNQETVNLATQLFQVHIHTGEEAIRVGEERNRLAYQRAAIETTTTELPSPDEPRN